MRKTERLDIFYPLISKIHKKAFPDWRFGQLLQNFLCWHLKEYGTDVFYPEEDQLAQRFVGYAVQNSPFKNIRKEDYDEEIRAISELLK